MPEFEENAPSSNQAESYTPSTDAAKNPRSRRRSGGFKTEVASANKGNMGPVDPATALKTEKLSGTGKPAESESDPRQERTERAPRKEHISREPRAPSAGRPEPREPQAERAPRAERPERAERVEREEKPRRERAPREDRPTAIPQPSAETLAAIATIEARLNDRKAERDTRRAERDKNRPAKSERNPTTKNTARNKPQSNRAAKGKGKEPETGLIAAITGFFGKLFGKAPEPAKKSNDQRGGRPQGKGGNRDGQNRRGGQNRGKGGQGRRPGGNRGGKGRRQGDQGGGEKRHTATSLSNES